MSILVTWIPHFQLFNASYHFLKNKLYHIKYKYRTELLKFLRNIRRNFIYWRVKVNHYKLFYSNSLDSISFLLLISIKINLNTHFHQFQRKHNSNSQLRKFHRNFIRWKLKLIKPFSTLIHQFPQLYTIFSYLLLWQTVIFNLMSFKEKQSQYVISIKTSSIEK